MKERSALGRRHVDYTLVRHGMYDWRLGANVKHIGAAK
jgi:hypothetical protein